MGNIERDLAMSINMNGDKNIPTDTEAYYETVASQEEIYLEEVEVEEELRAILIFSDPSPSRRDMKRSMTDPKDNPCLAESPDEQINHAAEELITGDSDDPPLSEEEVVGMLTDSPAQRLKSVS
jgi:hypothetical protein